MNPKLRRQLKKRKRKTLGRIDRNSWSGRSPMIRTPAVAYELSERQQAISAGGLGLLTQLAGKLNLRQAINAAIPVFKLHLPYDEADHVLNIAFNLLAGGTCLDHLEDRRSDEAYLNALDAQRIPDPTTAGDFCRRLKPRHIQRLMDAFNQTRLRVWKHQPPDFFDAAVIEADGTQVQTHAQKKQGIGINYKGQWGYHPLVVTLANTREPLYFANRSGNRPSHEGVAEYFGRAVALCRGAGFRQVRLRGDTDFSITDRFDGWDQDGVQFVFGYDAKKSLIDLADDLPISAWKPLQRRQDKTPASAAPRAKRPNHKEAVVAANRYRNQRLVGEAVAEFSYRPGKCHRDYRMVVIRKEIRVTGGQKRLFDDFERRYFFYITNLDRSEKTAAQIVKESNQRCDQENHIAQLKQCALVAPLSDLNSNWAYMVIASLAWNLKAWSGLLIKPAGPSQQRKEQAEYKRRILSMDFITYRDRVLNVPAQIIRSGRKLVYRLLSWRPSVDLLLLIHAQVTRPLKI